METHETRIAPAGVDGQHFVQLTFGARNAFGGMVRAVAVGTADSETCNATLIEILE